MILKTCTTHFADKKHFIKHVKTVKSTIFTIDIRTMNIMKKLKQAFCGNIYVHVIFSYIIYITRFLHVSVLVTDI